ncbi:MAG: hypothetical protein IJ403_07785 [Oscillospiraceae bacterium]|nr:hypothetical protein [Oscillospiraceae bacterium]
MEKWKHFPGVFRRKILLTALTGLGCGTVATVVFLVSNDRTMMMLGAIILLMCAYKTISFWNCAAGEHYHVLSGYCHIPKSYSPLRIRKVILTDSNGVETTLLLDRKAGIKDGLYYRLYFQGALPENTGNERLDAAMRSDTLIGLEQIDPEYIEREISECLQK